MGGIGLGLNNLNRTPHTHTYAHTYAHTYTILQSYTSTTYICTENKNTICSTYTSTPCTTQNRTQAQHTIRTQYAAHTRHREHRTNTISGHRTAQNNTLVHTLFTYIVLILLFMTIYQKTLYTNYIQLYTNNIHIEVYTIFQYTI